MTDAGCNAKLYYKYCFVPRCKSTTIKCPEKVFFTVPKAVEERAAWLKAARRDLKKSPIGKDTVAFCCEDHFNVETDVINWMKSCFYRERGFRTVRKLRPGVLPHRFECQKTEPTSRNGEAVLKMLSQNKMVASTSTSDLMKIEPSKDLEAYPIVSEAPELHPGGPDLGCPDWPVNLPSGADKCIQVRAQFRSQGVMAKPEVASKMTATTVEDNNR